MKTIITTDGHEMWVDDEDYDYLMLYDFTLNQHGYPIGKPKQKYKRIGLFSSAPVHKILIDKGQKGRHVVIDHVDGNKLNNQKENLRICSHAENMRNRKITTTYSNKETTSKYKGLVWRKKNKKWQVHISIEENKEVFVGYFKDEIAGANCYNYYAKKYHGEFARLNDVPYMPKEDWEALQSRKKKTSKYRGVSLIDGKWKAQIWDNKTKKNIQLGDFDEEVEAAKAWNQKAIELRCNNTKLNNIQ